MILFLCHGNIARSQFAEALLRQKGVVDVMSAGTHVGDDRDGRMLCHDGATASRLSTYFLEVTGIDISRQRRKRVSREMVERSTRIIVMTDPAHVPDFVLSTTADIQFWDIEDPHDMSLSECRLVIGQIRDKVEALHCNGPT